LIVLVESAHVERYVVTVAPPYVVEDTSILVVAAAGVSENLIFPETTSFSHVVSELK
jgi:hypothetical protein